MVTKQILEYIKTQQAQKTSNDEIETELRKSGWTQKDIDDAFVIVAGGKPTAEAPKTKSNQKTCLIIGAVAGCGCLALVVVFSIFGAAILVAINPAEQMKKAEEYKAKNDIIQIRLSLQTYFMENKAYPKSLNDLMPDYLPDIPIDQQTDEQYEYALSKDGKNYEICMSNKEPSEPPICLDANSIDDLRPQDAPPIGTEK